MQQTYVQRVWVWAGLDDPATYTDETFDAYTHAEEDDPDAIHAAVALAVVDEDQRDERHAQLLTAWEKAGLTDAQWDAATDPATGPLWDAYEQWVTYGEGDPADVIREYRASVR